MTHRIFFSDAYSGQRVLVTGHTGFKGSWLVLWLLNLNAKVAGYSLYLPSNPSNFEILGLKDKIIHYDGDIRDLKKLNKAFDEFQPQIVFHLAAQPIVSVSIDDPKGTFDTNVGGTVNVLECMRQHSSVEAAVIITSDKCYQNFEWEWGYRENDRLGGNDPYSASKACAEIVSNAYLDSYFYKKESPRVATTRAGNVIGGGDWAKDRIIPDCIRSLSNDSEITIRNPSATRPWQHVLEPVCGYLWLGALLLDNQEAVIGEAFNFGPGNNDIKTVSQIVELLIKYWGNGREYCFHSEENVNYQKESTLLKLSCEKALSRLGWHTILPIEDAVKLSAEWYHKFYNNHSMYQFSCDQIRYFCQKAIERNMPWTI